MLEPIDATWIGPAGLALALYVFGRPSLRRRSKLRQSRRKSFGTSKAAEDEAIRGARHYGSATYEDRRRASQSEATSVDDLRIASACAILGLELKSRATREDVHRAWKKSIKGKHPDQGGDAAEFSRIMDARNVLIDAISTNEASR